VAIETQITEYTFWPLPSSQQCPFRAAWVDAARSGMVIEEKYMTARIWRGCNSLECSSFQGGVFSLEGSQRLRRVLPFKYAKNILPTMVDPT
jgi:hypothetical protein